ncbi:hypothetical protein QY96_02364 [Bacillus thermotolerans]|uniref:Uncharacterized protein n=1 Tax=Bacillus thermotolerans TaxID=1221996 RepID=A0A0F5HPR6_BACTR|nr:hypothetical protein QY95_03537 [Bacillus thermotolerans]KKB40532.1 hypothetical protein QY96_02364 [Bacillus thermotolerans]
MPTCIKFSYNLEKEVYNGRDNGGKTAGKGRTENEATRDDKAGTIIGPTT